MVRVTGFEPAASCSQSRRATNCATPGYFVILSGWAYSPKAGALPTALHPVIQFFIRLGVFSQTTRATNCANPGFLMIEFCSRCGQTCGQADFLTTFTYEESACITGVSRDCEDSVIRLEGGATRSQTRRDTSFAIPGYARECR